MVRSRPTVKQGNDEWWARPGLEYLNRSLCIGGADCEALIKHYGTPLYVYDAGRIRERFRCLSRALQDRVSASRVLYAMKANPFPEILRTLHEEGAGIDAASFEELEFASALGFAENEISLTAIGLKPGELAGLGSYPGVLHNCNGLSELEIISNLGLRREIGIRVNPRLGPRRTGKLIMAGDTPTQFGVLPDRFDEALRQAEVSGLTVVGIHAHIGCGLLKDDLQILAQGLRVVGSLAGRVKDLRYVNVGGGLGVRMQEHQQEIPPEAYAQTVDEALAQEISIPTVYCEPGDYIVKDAGVLLTEITFVEEKGGCWFLGVDAGLHINNLAAHYGLCLHAVPCSVPAYAHHSTRTYAVVGQILETGDVFNQAAELADIGPGDHLALLTCGGYGASMTSAHCLRQAAAEVLVDSGRVVAARRRRLSFERMGRITS